MKNLPKQFKKFSQSPLYSFSQVLLGYLTIASIACLAMVIMQPSIILSPLFALVRCLYLLTSALRAPLSAAFDSVRKQTEQIDPYASPFMLIQYLSQAARCFISALFKSDNRENLKCLSLILCYILVTPMCVFLTGMGMKLISTALNSVIEIALCLFISKSLLTQRYHEFQQARSSKSPGAIQEPLMAMLATSALMVWLVHDELSIIAPPALKGVLSLFSYSATHIALSSLYLWNMAHWCFNSLLRPLVLTKTDKSSLSAACIKTILSSSEKDKSTILLSNEDIKTLNDADKKTLQEGLKATLALFEQQPRSTSIEMKTT